MATGEMKARLDVIGSDKTKRAFSSVRKNITGFNSELKRTALTFAGAFAGKQLIDMADSITDLRNRLNSFNNDLDKTNYQMSLITQTALKTRSSFEATGVVFTRMIQATQHLGLESEALAAATATVNATFKLSGTTAYEAANSARQLAQGLSSGRLSGDEMRSVLENNVVLANLLAEGFGKTVGQLRIMGAAGKVTTEKIMPILIASFEETTRKVSEMQLTVDASFTLLITRAYESINAINKLTGFTDTIANSIGYVSRHMNEFAVIATGVLLPAIGMLAAGFIGLLKSMVLLVLANPLTAFFALLGGGFAYVLTISEEFQRRVYNALGKLFIEQIPNLFTSARIALLKFILNYKDQFNVLIEDVIQPAVNGIYEAENAIRGFFGVAKLQVPTIKIDTKEIKESIQLLEGGMASFKEIAEGEPLPIFEEGGFLHELTPEAIMQQLKDSMKVADEFKEDMIATLAETIDKQKSFGQEVAGIINKTFEGLADAITEFVITGKNQLSDLINMITKDLLNAMIRAKITQPLQTSFSEFLASEGKQGGGFVVGKTPYMVGEKGAELFIPATSGRIIPNRDLAGGGNITINQSVNFATGVQDTVKNEVLQLLPEIAETSKGAVLEAMSRGGNFRRGLR